MSTLSGWPVVDSGQITRFYVPGDNDGCTVRTGTEKAFAWLAKKLTDVEPLVTLHGWRSEAENASVKGDPRSDHLAGVAIDWNGAQHPYEANMSGAWYSGFTNQEITQIRGILSYAGIFRWGMDYNPGYRDAMHFAFKPGVTWDDVKAFIKKIEADEPTGVPTDNVSEETSMRLIRRGSEGSWMLYGIGQKQVISDAQAAALLRDGMKGEARTPADFDTISSMCGGGTLTLSQQFIDQVWSKQFTDPSNKLVTVLNALYQILQDGDVNTSDDKFLKQRIGGTVSETSKTVSQMLKMLLSNDEALAQAIADKTSGNKATIKEALDEYYRELLADG